MVFRLFLGASRKRNGWEMPEQPRDEGGIEPAKLNSQQAGTSAFEQLRLLLGRLELGQICQCFSDIAVLQFLLSQ